jgi:hypothetical protein
MTEFRRQRADDQTLMVEIHYLTSVICSLSSDMLNLEPVDKTMGTK